MTTRTTAELADALEARAPYYDDWARDIRELNGKSVDADHSEATAALLRAAASRLRELESALKEMLEMGELFIPTKLHSPGFKRARRALRSDTP